MKYARIYLRFIRTYTCLLQPLFLYLMTMNSVLVKHCHPATLNTMLICPKF